MDGVFGLGTDGSLEVIGTSDSDSRSAHRLLAENVVYADGKFVCESSEGLYPEKVPSAAAVLIIVVVIVVAAIHRK